MSVRGNETPARSRGERGRFTEELRGALRIQASDASLLTTHPEGPGGPAAVRPDADHDTRKPVPFMDTSRAVSTSPPTRPAAATQRSAQREVQSFRIAGRALYLNGNVVLTEAAEPAFAVPVANGGETPEAAVAVEIIFSTSADRQSKSATIKRIDPKGVVTTVEASGFNPGELDETSRAT